MSMCLTITMGFVGSALVRPLKKAFDTPDSFFFSVVVHEILLLFIEFSIEVSFM